ncbi:MAG TPA: molecular chaperone HtpG [Cryomorphaceae bacterium]|nr:molecular chaperone HtpG [Cryomorphaceae bacterium]
MQQGSINVQTENIFPIIKKFLYSDHEIFLRELVSNAVDATQKLKTLSGLGELKANTENLKVEVILNKDKKQIIIRDNGIGMTSEEIEKYINQIAFSGAEEFVEKYKDADSKNAIIGHFGLGFYSAFMVAKQVEIISKSQKPNSVPVKWTCDGSPNYTMEETKKKTKGTDIILHIAEDSTEFLEESRISGILNKYCKFLPVPIKFGTNERTEKERDSEGEVVEGGKEEKIVEDNIVNNTDPAWTKIPSELSDEDYKNFYRELYPMTFEDPLFHIHLNVDFPFNLTGVLYFPKLKNNLELQKNKISLYSNQVFITDNVENIVPEFLTLLHGVIDSPDIPLNVSRSYLQEDAAVKKISSHITKKVADKLNSMFKNDREDFEKKWEDIKVFIEFGMLTDEKFYDRASKFYLFKSVDGKYYTIEEYKEKIAATQTDKNDKTIVLYAQDEKEQYSFIQTAKDRSYDVVIMDTPISSHLISKLEQKVDKFSFARVDADTIDKLIQKDEEIPSKLTEGEKETLKPIIEDSVEKEKFSVQFESMSETDRPIIITQSEFMRRMKEQQMSGGGANMFGAMPEMYNMVVNANHPLITQLINTEESKRKETVGQLIDLALLSQNMLKGEAMSKFIQRSVDLMKS